MYLYIYILVFYKCMLDIDLKFTWNLIDIIINNNYRYFVNRFLFLAGWPAKTHWSKIQLLIK